MQEIKTESKTLLLFGCLGCDFEEKIKEFLFRVCFFIFFQAWAEKCARL